MYGADYAWILQESLEQHRWWENDENLECSLKHLHSAVENVLLVSSFNNIVGNEKSISGLVNSSEGKCYFVITFLLVFFFRFTDECAFRAGAAGDEHHKTVFTFRPGNLRCCLEHCAHPERCWGDVEVVEKQKKAEILWLHEKRLGEGFSRAIFTIKIPRHFGELQEKSRESTLLKEKKLNYSTTTRQGNVSFDGADRIGITAFHQIQYAQLQPVALYYPETVRLDFNCQNCMTIKWENNVVPIAKRIFKLRIATISRYAFFTITSLAFVGIVLSIMFLAFNIHYRKLKWVELIYCNETIGHLFH